ncbi:MAG TPA: RNA 2',3'-cyclic phosphodiesterase [Pyrinomonadaceae bacterium]|nr:RNA 2',3'-cyclic phosphodiesterase [Pyrinomonadaceae bacterium]
MKVADHSVEGNVKPSRHESWRIFCAIDLSTSVRENLLRHIVRLREAVPYAQASWSRAENTHLTLKFLGEIQTSKLSRLSDAVSRAVAGVPSFQVKVEETGVFPKPTAPRVLWIGVKDESEKLATLQSRLEEECSREGFAREDRPFHPHLTIARLRKPEGVRALAAAHTKMHFDPIALEISECMVIRSEPGSAGSKYTVISRHTLDG